MSDLKYFVKDRTLFCNTLFRKKGQLPEDDHNLEDSDYIKSFYELESIIAGNVAEIKSLSTIRTKDGNSFTIEVPFKELVKLKYGIEI